MHLHLPTVIIKLLLFGAYLRTTTRFEDPYSMASSSGNTQDNIVKEAESASLRMRYRELVPSENKALSMLRQRNILRTSMWCPGKHGESCDRIMKEWKRKNRNDVWCCPAHACRKQLSLRTGCSFLSFPNNRVRHKTNFPLTQVLEIIWLFLLMKGTIRDAAQISGHSTHTIVNWRMM